MKFLKYFEGYKKNFREVDLAKIWNCVNDTDFMRIYYDEFDDDWLSPKKFLEKMLQIMLVDKEIEFRRAVHPIDGEISYAFGCRVKSVRIPDSIIIESYESDTTYVLAHFYAGKMSNVDQAMKGKQIIKIYNSKITEIEQKLEDIEMRLDAKKYNL